MRGQRTCSALLAALLLMIGPAVPPHLWAEFYRYVGKDGAIHFTDDLSQVPLDQREKMEAYTGAQPAPAPAPEAPQLDAATEAANRAKEAVTYLEAQRQDLMTRQELLKTEYQRLMDAKAEVEALRQSADTPEKRQTLQAKVTALQADIAAYETQTKALQEEVNAFNSAIEAAPPVEAASE